MTFYFTCQLLSDKKRRQVTTRIPAHVIHNDTCAIFDMTHVPYLTYFSNLPTHLRYNFPRRQIDLTGKYTQ